MNRLRWRRSLSLTPLILFWASFFIMQGCARHVRSSKGGDNPGGRFALELPDNWSSSVTPAGLSLYYPNGWRILTREQPGLHEIIGDKGERQLIWPMFYPGTVTAAQLNAIATAIAKNLCVDGRWSQPESLADGAVRMVGGCAELDAVTLLASVTSPKGTAILVVMAAAPSDRFKSSIDKFVTILKSLRLTGLAQVVPPTGALQPFARWQEPREQAFSLEVPVGWSVTGGLYRMAPLDTRKAWRAQSPDGKKVLLGGDSNVPYFVPRVSGRETYYPQGSWYPGSRASTTNSQQWLVMPYKSAGEFIKSYVASRFDACGQLQLGTAQTRSDLEEPLGRVYDLARGSYTITISQADARFRCQKNGLPMEGYILVGTTLFEGGTSAVWKLENIYAYLAPEGQGEESEAILQHMASSIKMDESWVALQTKINGNSVKIAAEAAAEISRAIGETYELRQKNMDEISRRRSHAAIFKVDVVDPATGRQLRVDSSANYYWLDNRGTIIGTGVNSLPSLDFRASMQRP